MSSSVTRSLHNLTPFPISTYSTKQTPMIRFLHYATQFRIHSQFHIKTYSPLYTLASGYSSSIPSKSPKHEIPKEDLQENTLQGIIWTPQEIAEATGGKVIISGPPGSITTDTRTLQPGQWFLALKGSRFDGHDFMQSALSKGCAGVIGHRVLANWSRGFVKVESSTLLALQSLGSSARKRFNGPVVGITGSVGKTTTRAMMALVLASAGPTHQTLGNQNNHVGVPLSLISMPLDSWACVLELGMNHVGEIGELAAIAEPSVRVVLNVGHAHMENFGSLEEVARAKGEILVGARQGDVCVLNGDDPLVAGLPVPHGAKRVLFGSNSGCNVRLIAAESIQRGCAVRVTLEHSSSSNELKQDSLDSSEHKYQQDFVTACPVGSVAGETYCNSDFLMSMGSESKQSKMTDSKELREVEVYNKSNSRAVFDIPSPGLHLAMNACAAAAVAITLGIPLAQVGKSLSEFSPVNMRLWMETFKNGITVINDAYNANPMSMVAALKLLHSLNSQGRKVAVLGDMLELGIYGKNAHVDILKMCQEIGIQLLGVAGLHFTEAIKAMHVDCSDFSIISAPNSESLASQINKKLNVGDIVLVKGSRGMRMEVVADVIKKITFKKANYG